VGWFCALVGVVWLLVLVLGVVWVCWNLFAVLGVLLFWCGVLTLLVACGWVWWLMFCWWLLLASCVWRVAIWCLVCAAGVVLVFTLFNGRLTVVGLRWLFGVWLVELLGLRRWLLV
jgi:hypothetical protein